MRRYKMILSAQLVATSLCYSAVMLDRIAVVVGKHVIKTSDIQRDLRVTAFLNRQSLDLTPQAKRQAAERLIDQEIIRQEIVTGEYRRPPESEAAALEKQLADDRYGGSQARVDQDLARYGLSEQQLRSQLLWQLTVLQFIDQRFRPEVYVSDEEVRAYYDQHQAELRKQHPADSAFEALQGQIRQILEGEQINQKFTAWLEEARKRAHIDYRQEAFV
jgi:hypothetical protein